jgi:hypothetical protein
MTTNFNFNSNIKDIQNRLVSSTIKDVSNLDFLKSEEAIRDVIKSYTDRFNASEGMLTNISKYIVKSKSLIKLSDFNNLFESLYIDLVALYKDLELVDTVLTLNLNRNKNYFLVLKKRVRDLWQRLELTRLQVYDLSPADESFYESFYSAINSTSTSNIEVDKKNGFLVLSSKRRRLLNSVPYIKSVTSVTYPVENEEGGVLITTSPLNDLNENYTTGTKDLLSDGLWKEQVLCKEIPDMFINTGFGNKNFKGVVSIVDIEYTYPVELNRIDIDIFGEKVLDIDRVLYKTSSTSEWLSAIHEKDDPLITEDPTEAVKFSSVAGRAFDIISFMNIRKIKVKKLRLIFNQQNYSLLDSDSLPERTLEDQINKDLEERRYELVKFDASIEEELTSPVNENNRSIYHKVMSAIESTRNIKDILDKINKILVPEVRTISTVFSKTAMFELGAWSIEPMIEEYTKLEGRYDSKPYSIRDKNLLAVQLKTDQEAPNASTCNWYINVNGSNIPIVENDSAWRKEPLNFVDLGAVNASYRDWPGSFILLDFPIDPIRYHQIGFYENGIFNYDFSYKIVFLNSRLLYLHDLTNPSQANYVIRYPLASYNTVNLYGLNQKSRSNTISYLSLGIISSRREVLEKFIIKAKSLVDFSNTDVPGQISENYTISSALATIDESKAWFGSSYASCIFIDDTIRGYLDITGIGSLSSIITSNVSKLNSTLSDVLTYRSGTSQGMSDLSLIGLYQNVAPQTIKRTI